MDSKEAPTPAPAPALAPVLQGRGVTNFDASKTTYALSLASVTEFDEQVARRGIASYEQVFLSKGATPEEASRLANEKRADEERSKRDRNVETAFRNDEVEPKPAPSNDKEDSDSDGISDFEDDENDEFFEQYRQERMAQMTERETQHGEIPHIKRSEWKERVNDASHRGWVVVTLIDRANLPHIREELHQLARQPDYKEITFLTIEFHEAIPDWPTERVPSMFVYRDGVKQVDWITERYGVMLQTSELDAFLRHWRIVGED